MLYTMKAVLQLKNLNCSEGKGIILRNLSRIMDIRIIDIDVDRGLLFLYAGPLALQQVRRELSRLGYPIQSCKFPVSDLPELGGKGTLKAEAV